MNKNRFISCLPLTQQSVAATHRNSKRTTEKLRQRMIKVMKAPSCRFIRGSSSRKRWFKGAISPGQTKATSHNVSNRTKSVSSLVATTSKAPRICLLTRDTSPQEQPKDKLSPRPTSKFTTITSTRWCRLLPLNSPTTPSSNSSKTWLLRLVAQRLTSLQS